MLMLYEYSRLYHLFLLLLLNKQFVSYETWKTKHKNEHKCIYHTQRFKFHCLTLHTWSLHIARDLGHKGTTYHRAQLHTLLYAHSHATDNSVIQFSPQCMSLDLGRKPLNHMENMQNTGTQICITLSVNNWWTGPHKRNKFSHKYRSRDCLSVVVYCNCTVTPTSKRLAEFCFLTNRQNSKTMWFLPLLTQCAACALCVTV